MRVRSDESEQVVLAPGTFSASIAEAGERYRFDFWRASFSWNRAPLRMFPNA